MEQLEAEIEEFEQTLDKLSAQKNAAQITAHSEEFVFSNIKVALELLDKIPPAEQQKLLNVIINEIGPC